MDVSQNTIERICKIFGFLSVLEKKGITYASSKELAQAIDATEYTVRKDISLLGVTGYTRKGYNVTLLKKQLSDRFHLGKERKACIIGLGRLGTALLDYERFQEDGFMIVAGFDNSINKIERIRTSIDVFAIDQLMTVIKDRDIELGIIAVPAEAAQEVADSLINAGIKGILNFSPQTLKLPKNIIYTEMDFTNSLRYIAVQFSLKNNE